MSSGRGHVYMNKRVGRYLISEDGSRVKYTTFEGIDYDSVGGYFVGVVLPYVLQVRGYIPLHGSSVVIGGRAWAFLGGPGVGKSTLQTQFLREGYTFFADDVIALREEGELIAYPGYPALKLEPESRFHLPNKIVTGEQFLAEGATKAVYSLAPDVVSHEPVPFGGILLLDPDCTSQRQDVQFIRPGKSERVLALMGNTFTLSVTHQEMQKRYLAAFSSRHFQEVPIWRVQYLHHYDLLPEIVQQFLYKINSSEMRLC